MSFSGPGPANLPDFGTLKASAVRKIINRDGNTVKLALNINYSMIYLQAADGTLSRQHGPSG